MASGRPRSLRTLAFGPLSMRRSPFEPPSPTLTEATHTSAVNFGANGPEKIITRADLRAGIQAFDNLMSASSEYRAALLAMSKAAASFAEALERCSSLKGPSYDAGTRLQAASGLHHLIGNHWHLLAETIDKKFEKPLRQHLDSYRTVVNERSTTYEGVLRQKSQIIRDTETRSLNRKERNLQSFREALTILQRQVEDLDDLKANHYREIVDHEEKVWDAVHAKSSIVVRSTMDVFDRVTSKASDPIIEVILQSVPDPFDSYGPPPSDNQIFSILAPLSIMTTQLSPPTLITSQSEKEPGESERTISSWLPGTSNETSASSESNEWARVHNSPSPLSTPPRCVSPPLLSRKPSSPPSVFIRKTESKLRNVLSSIDETVVKSNVDDLDAQPVDPTCNTDGIQLPTQLDTGQKQLDWSAVYGRSAYENVTPRNSMFFPSPANLSPEEPPSQAVVTPLTS